LQVFERFCQEFAGLSAGEFLTSKPSRIWEAIDALFTWETIEPISGSVLKEFIGANPANS